MKNLIAMQLMMNLMNLKKNLMMNMKKFLMNFCLKLMLL